MDTNLKLTMNFIAAVLVLSCVGCSDPTTTDVFSDSMRAEVGQEVEDATWKFHAADTSRDAEAVVDLLWPEFSLLGDGKRSDYGVVAEGARQFMNDVEVFETNWTDLKVTPLSNHLAISSFIFEDRIVMKSGKVIEAWGPNTFVWEKRGDAWKVLYTDADHYSTSR